ncbi:MAG TPA: hypothetical protein VK654_05860 [Nitrospirota bacterium]|nr:hypothetical protein [Nitrospirota bacterium]
MKKRKGMIIRYTKEKSESHENKRADGSGTVPDDACRCKEVSKMTPRELLDLMMKDLAFWKKEKKEK